MGDNTRESSSSGLARPTTLIDKKRQAASVLIESEPATPVGPSAEGTAVISEQETVSLAESNQEVESAPQAPVTYSGASTAETSSEVHHIGAVSTPLHQLNQLESSQNAPLDHSQNFQNLDCGDCSELAKISPRSSLSAIMQPLREKKAQKLALRKNVRSKKMQMDKLSTLFRELRQAARLFSKILDLQIQHFKSISDAMESQPELKNNEQIKNVLLLKSMGESLQGTETLSFDGSFARAQAALSKAFQSFLNGSKVSLKLAPWVKSSYISEIFSEEELAAMTEQEALAQYTRGDFKLPPALKNQNLQRALVLINFAHEVGLQKLEKALNSSEQTEKIDEFLDQTSSSMLYNLRFRLKHHTSIEILDYYQAVLEEGAKAFSAELSSENETSSSEEAVGVKRTSNLNRVQSSSSTSAPASNNPLLKSGFQFFSGQF